MMVYSLILDNIINYIISIFFIMLRQLSIVGVLVMSISRTSIYIYIQQIGSRYSSSCLREGLRDSGVSLVCTVSLHTVWSEGGC